jgi:hypothetical protein
VSGALRPRNVFVDNCLVLSLAMLPLTKLSAVHAYAYPCLRLALLSSGPDTPPHLIPR